MKGLARQIRQHANADEISIRLLNLLLPTYYQLDRLRTKATKEDAEKTYQDFHNFVTELRNALLDGDAPAPEHNIVKFVVVRQSTERIIFGTRDYKSDFHEDVAKDAKVARRDVLSGGIADLATKKIFGKSNDFGCYDPEMIKRMLPDWTVLPPSEYM